MSTSALCAVHCTIIVCIVQRRNETRKRTYIRLGREKAPEFIVSNNGGFGFSLNPVYCCLYFMYNFIFLFFRYSFCFQCATVQLFGCLQQIQWTKKECGFEIEIFYLLTCSSSLMRQKHFILRQISLHRHYAQPIWADDICEYVLE